MLVDELGCGLRPAARGFDSRVFDAVWEAEDGKEDGGNLQERNQESRPKGLRGTALSEGLGCLLQNQRVSPVHSPEGLPVSYLCFCELFFPLSQAKHTDNAGGAALSRR